MKRFFQFSLAFASLTLLGYSANAQVIFSSNLDSGDGWAVVADDDSDVEYGFDYSPFGIPSAPNGDGTTGLKLSANITDQPPGASSISAYPVDVNLTGQYQVKFDFWLNFNSSGGTTESGGVMVGFDPAGGPLNGAGYLGNTDGDTNNADHLLYLDGVALDHDPSVYAIPSREAGDIADLFPSNSTPEAQSMAPFDPTNVIVSTPGGTLGYAWHTLTADVDTDAGTARITVDDVEIGTVTGVSSSGTFALTYRDPFNSVSTKPEFSFGVFDNVVVSQVPEPNSAIAMLIGLGCLAIRRSRS